MSFNKPKPAPKPQPKPSPFGGPVKKLHAAIAKSCKRCGKKSCKC